MRAKMLAGRLCLCSRLGAALLNVAPLSDGVPRNPLKTATTDLRVRYPKVEASIVNGRPILQALPYCSSAVCRSRLRLSSAERTKARSPTRSATCRAFSNRRRAPSSSPRSQAIAPVFCQ